MGLTAIESIAALEEAIRAAGPALLRRMHQVRIEVVDEASSRGVGLGSRRFVMEADAAANLIDQAAREWQGLAAEVLGLVTDSALLPQAEALAAVLNSARTKEFSDVSMDMESKAAAMGALQSAKAGIDSLRKREFELAASQLAAMKRALVDHRNRLNDEEERRSRDESMQRRSHRLAVWSFAVSTLALLVSGLAAWNSGTPSETPTEVTQAVETPAK